MSWSPGEQEFERAPCCVDFSRFRTGQVSAPSARQQALSAATAKTKHGHMAAGALPCGVLRLLVQLKGSDCDVLDVAESALV